MFMIGDGVALRRLVAVWAMIAVCCGIRAQERGMSNPDAVFIEKGTVSAGLSLGFDSWDASGEKGFELLGIIRELEGYVRKAEVAAYGSWFIRDNLSVGVRVGYTDTRVQVDTTHLAELVIPDRHITSQSFNGALTCRGYLPLFGGNIIAMFCEGRLSGSVGYYKDYKVTDNGKEGNYNDIRSASLGLYPGISVFATRDISFEVSLPLLEGGVRWQKQDGTETDGTLTHSFFNFKPSLTGIRMGLVYHF